MHSRRNIFKFAILWKFGIGKLLQQFFGGATSISLLHDRPVECVLGTQWLHIRPNSLALLPENPIGGLNCSTKRRHLRRPVTHTRTRWRQ